MIKDLLPKLKKHLFDNDFPTYVRMLVHQNDEETTAVITQSSTSVDIEQTELSEIENIHEEVIVESVQRPLRAVPSSSLKPSPSFLKEHLKALLPASIQRGSILPRTSRSSQGGRFMGDFFDEVESIHGFFVRIEESVSCLRDFVNLITNNANENSMESTGDYHDGHEEFRTTRKLVNLVRTHLTDMLTSINDAEGNSQSPHILQFRIRRIQHMALSSMFLELVNDFNEVQTVYQNHLHNVSQRNGIIEDEGNEQAMELITESSVTVGTTRAEETLITQRHEEMLKLENSLRDIYDCMLELAEVIQDSHLLIKTIEDNLERAVDLIDYGRALTGSALELDRASRRKKKCLILVACFLGTVIVVVMVIIFLSVKPLQ